MTELQHNKDIYMIVSKNIKKYRKKNNLTQLELSKISGYSYSYIRRIEGPNCPKHFSLQTMDNISKVLKINIIQLFEDKDI